MKNVQKFQRILCLVLAMVLGCISVWAQGLVVKGVVLDDAGESIIGASVLIKGTSEGTTTDIDGRFSLKVPSQKSVLVISFIGMTSKEVTVGANKNLKVTLSEDNQQLDEVVVVGYGQQKKASVVGAITQTTGKVLQRAAGITDIGQALTGNLPGVITSVSTGMPGEEEPQIVIRGASSWNSSSPLILVDGVERPMSSVDMSSVESLSVLKDASATAVYGVRGANGVILITTKRGAEGKAKINVSANAIMKVPSKLPNKMDSYDALMARNTAIENELNISPQSWSFIRSQDFINNYRNQTTIEQKERYPNVDWQDVLFKDYAMSYNANINVSGGTKQVKYFASVDFVNEGDLFKDFDNHRGYKSGYGYNRVNVRSNLDFQVTKTTLFKVNVAGSNGVQKSPFNNAGDSDWAVAQQWAGAYNIAPDVFLPQYSDGSWGYYTAASNVSNSAENVSTGGAQKTTTTRITTDFVLEQNLDFITKGLSLRGMVSWDNTFREYKRGIDDLYRSSAQHKWINPLDGSVSYKEAYEQSNKFDFQEAVLWTIANGEVQNWSTQRNLYYQGQINWVRKFGKHDLTAMGLVSRSENATGSEIPNFRENWAFRATYNYDMKYFAEYNGAYNGSEKFAKENRFALFQSGAVGWTISKEKFMNWATQPKVLDNLKLRVSYGESGDDNVYKRWLYMTQWSYGEGSGNTHMNTTNVDNSSPYTWYRESAIGNEDVHWEVVRKLNFGIDYGFFDGLVSGAVEIFRDKRTDILVGGSDRSMPSYYGQNAPTANLGKVNTKGYEVELRLNKTFKNGIHTWANLNFTHAENKIKVKDDPALLPSYRKQAGYAIGQTHSYIDNGFIGSYDEIYASPKHDSNDGQKLVGDYYIVDFDGDGKITQDDAAPYGYSGTPQNTYNATLGIEYKGWSAFAQFYGVNNVTRDVWLSSFGNQLDNVYDTGTWWANNHKSADVVTPRWQSTPTYAEGTQYYYDGSFVRLKNIEVAYTFNGGILKQLGISDLKLFVSGNNLWVWTKLPDDRESNFAGGSGSGAYPTVKRVNFGLKFSL